MIEFIILFICSCLLSVLLHEGVHIYFACVFKLKPKLRISKFGTPIVQYKNNNNYIQILIVAVSAPILLISISLVLPNSNMYILFKVMGLCNVFNLLPVTADGEVALYAILHLWKDHQRKKY